MNGITDGDDDFMIERSGNKYVKHLVGATILFDFYKYNNPNSKHNLGFIAPQGAPGLAYTIRY